MLKVIKNEINAEGQHKARKTVSKMGKTQGKFVLQLAKHTLSIAKKQVKKHMLEIKLKILFQVFDKLI